MYELLPYGKYELIVRGQKAHLHIEFLTETAWNDC
jgi:hypothetical protein